MVQLHNLFSALQTISMLKGLLMLTLDLYRSAQYLVILPPPLFQLIFSFYEREGIVE